jgi:serine/threonine protein kinase
MNCRPKAVSDWIRSLDDYKKVRNITGSVSLYQRGEEQIAVKFFKYSQNDDQTFIREFDSLARLQHRCILPLKFVCLRGRREGPLIAAEYLGGGPLKDTLSSRPFWWTPTRRAITVMGIALGMQYVHSCQIMHRDLKPGNILFDCDLHPYVADFGTARASDLDVTLTRDIGTPLYMAPEIYDGKENYTPKIDVYSFGLILYEIVAANGLLGDDSQKFRLWKFFASGGRPDIPGIVGPRMRSMIERCWSAVPDERPEFSEIVVELRDMKSEIVPNVDPQQVDHYFAWATSPQ